MDPIYLLQELNLLNKSVKILDVGTKDGYIAMRLADLGNNVTAIDINDIREINNISFQKISVENFLENNEELFDVIIARDVLHLVEDPISILMRLYSRSQVLFFTLFGKQDEWTNINGKSIESIKNLFPENEIIHISEAFQIAPANNGDLKKWHIYSFVICKLNY